MKNNLSNIKERILYLAENVEVSKQEFFRKINITYGNFTGDKKKRPINSDTIENILLSYPETNPEWLLTGKGEMLKEKTNAVRKEQAVYETAKRKNLIPLYEDAQTIGGTSTVANMEPVQHVSEWIDAGDWFPGATAAIRHYGDSMPEYPSGCILALKEVLDRSLIVWGRNYCIETSEYRVTKKIYDDGDIITAYSTNEDTYKNGRLIHPPFPIPKKSILKMYLVLGYVVKEYSNGPVIISK